MPIITAKIKSKGKELNPIYELVRIDIYREVNQIPFARIILIDGDSSTHKFPLSNEDFFTSGNEIEIQLGYEGWRMNSKTVFKGVVIRHALESDGIESFLTIELRNETNRMTLARKSAVHKGTDSSIIKKLIKESNLTPDIKDNNKPKHDEIRQYYCSDWDFILSRAAAQNLLVIVKDKTVSLKPLKIQNAVKHKFEYGFSDIYRFKMEAVDANQVDTVNKVIEDRTKSTISKSERGTQLSLDQDEISPKKIKQKFDKEEFFIVSAAESELEETKNWISSHLTRSRLSRIRGSITVPGFAEIALLDVIKIVGFGNRFNGKALVTRIHHQVDQDGWQLTIQFGVLEEDDEK